MPKLWRALAAGCSGLLGWTAPAWAQADADFTLIRDWTPAGEVESRAVADTLLLSAGSIHTASQYGDFIFRFDFRPPSPGASASLLLRVHDGEDGSRREYGVALGGQSRGQLSAQGMLLHERRGTFLPSAAAGADWTSCEVRVDNGHLTVRLDGSVVAHAERLEKPGGRIGFRAGPGGIELRRMRVAELAKPVSSFHSELPAAESPGIQRPTLKKQAKPVYPEKAKRAGITGTVLLEIVILPEGVAGDINVVSAPHPDLIEPSIVCVRKWRFEPARKDGAPLAVTATVEVSFDLAR